MSTRSSILEQVIKPKSGTLSTELAHYLLSLEFPESSQARYAELAAKAQAGALSPDEELELDEFLSVNDFLAIVRSKARASLAPGSSAAGTRGDA